MATYKDYGYTTNAPDHTFFYLQPPLMDMLDKDTNKCILDLGCGNGYIASFLLAQGYNVFGTDASEEGINIAKQANPDRFFLQDLSTGKLPEELQQQQFDTIISTEVIEHLYDPGGFIDLCRSVLGGKGQIIISTPYHGYLKNLALSLFNKWDTHLNPMWHGGHIKMWSRYTLSKALTDAGFRDVEFVGCGRVPYFWRSMIIKAKLG